MTLAGVGRGSVAAGQALIGRTAVPGNRDVKPELQAAVDHEAAVVGHGQQWHPALAGDVASARATGDKAQAEAEIEVLFGRPGDTARALGFM